MVAVTNPKPDNNLGKSCGNPGDEKLDENKYICQTKDSDPVGTAKIWKGKQNSTCNNISKSLDSDEWENFDSLKTTVDLNAKMDPSDNCARELLCDHRFICCGFGKCDWPEIPPNNAPKEDIPYKGDVPKSISSDKGDKTFSNDILTESVYEGGSGVVRDESVNSGLGEGSNRTILIPDTELKDDDTSILSVATDFINWTLGFLGILVFMILLLSAFEYATAGGDDNKTTKAISRIRSAVIGGVILFFTYVLTNLVVSLALGMI